ncbi:MAG: helix-turn-helix domain-containing protein, partial [Streptococcaceae bacterium]|nr:helix-turn-helix domain-containing protein [Streptococcaceae bacterium]
PKKISRVVKKHTGMTFRDYTIQLKMEFAQKYLNEQKYSKEEISLMLGYKEPRFFLAALARYKKKKKRGK